MSRCGSFDGYEQNQLAELLEKINFVSTDILFIMEGTTSIKANAFWNCTNLTRVIIPDSVTSIKDRTFYNCKLTNVTIGSNVTIGKNAFELDKEGSIGFVEAYENNGKKAGTYTSNRGNWKYKK